MIWTTLRTFRLTRDRLVLCLDQCEPVIADKCVTSIMRGGSQGWTVVPPIHRRAARNPHEIAFSAPAPTARHARPQAPSLVLRYLAVLPDFFAHSSGLAKPKVFLVFGIIFATALRCHVPFLVIIVFRHCYVNLCKCVMRDILPKEDRSQARTTISYRSTTLASYPRQLGETSTWASDSEVTTVLHWPGPYQLPQQHQSWGHCYKLLRRSAEARCQSVWAAPAQANLGSAVICLVTAARALTCKLASLSSISFCRLRTVGSMLEYIH